MMLVFAIISFLAVLAWDLFTDYRKWLSRKPVRHGSEYRAVLLIPSVVTLAVHFGASPGHDFWRAVLLVIWSACIEAAIWWLLFDGLFNSIRGFGWWFNGSLDPDGEDSKLDRFLSSLQDWQEAAIKLGAIAFGALAKIYIIG